MATDFVQKWGKITYPVHLSLCHSEMKWAIVLRMRALKATLIALHLGPTTLSVTTPPVTGAHSSTNRKGSIRVLSCSVPLLAEKSIFEITYFESSKT